ncbi:9243_t:CDS:2, partial [Dentiscutata heterogama]
FDDSFKGVHSLQDFEDARQEDLSTKTIETNLRVLKGNLKKSEAQYAKPLRKIIGKVKFSKLSWHDPLASQVLSSEAKKVKQLLKKEYVSFIKLAKKMKISLPPLIETVCNNFLTNYDNGSTEIPSQKLSYKNWRESEEVLKDISVGILETLGEIWKNLAFTSKFAKTQSEKIYVADIIVPIIQATLKNLPIGKFALASKDRRGEREKHSDIMFIVKHIDRIYELVFSKYLRIVCNNTKEDDDK